MDIVGTFEAAQACGLARSRRRFSEEFLGMAPNYAADTGLRRVKRQCLAASL